MHTTASTTARRRSVWRPTAAAAVPAVQRSGDQEIRVLSDGLKGRPSIVEITAHRGAALPSDALLGTGRVLVLEGRVTVSDVEVGPHEDVPCDCTDRVTVASDAARFLITSHAAVAA